MAQPESSERPVISKEVIEAAYVENQLFDAEKKRLNLENRLGKINDILRLQLELDVEDFVATPVDVNSPEESIQAAIAMLTKHGRLDRASDIANMFENIETLSTWGYFLTDGVVYKEDSRGIRIGVPEPYPVFTERDENDEPLGVKWSVPAEGYDKRIIIDAETLLGSPDTLETVLDTTYVGLEKKAAKYIDQFRLDRFSSEHRLPQLVDKLKFAVANYDVLFRDQKVNKFGALLSTLQDLDIRRTIAKHPWAIPQDYFQEQMVDTLKNLHAYDSEGFETLELHVASRLLESEHDMWDGEGLHSGLVAAFTRYTHLSDGQSEIDEAKIAAEEIRLLGLVANDERQS